MDFETVFWNDLTGAARKGFQGLNSACGAS